MPERLVLDLEATADCAFDPDFNYKLQGRLYNALADTELDGVHDSNAPAPFTFSNPRPHGDMATGDTRSLIVSSPHGRGLYDHVVADLAADPELNLGHMCFRVRDARTVTIGVGDPGTSGVIRTPTGVFQRLSAAVCERHGIDLPADGDRLYWASDDHPPLALFEQARRNLAAKLDAYHPASTPAPDPTSDRLFTGYELVDAGGMHKTVSSAATTTLLYSKWRLEYEVRDATHRRWLNTLVACGLGARNALGLGYLHLDDPARTSQPSETAAASSRDRADHGAGGTGDDAVACPTCGRRDFASRQGMRQHHAKAHEESLAAETRVCPNCSEEFTVPHWRAKRCCSRGCANQFRGEGKRERRDCAWCGLSLETWPSWDTEYHQECYFEATADRGRPGELEALAREVYGEEERALREAWRLVRGHGFEVTREEFRELLADMEVLRESLASQLEAAEVEVDPGARVR